MNPVSLRLINQQLVSPQFSNPADLVSYMCAIQAQEYRLMRWAVEMRTSKPSSNAFEDAFNKGKIIRVHLLRGTWQLISAGDYYWMMDLFSSKATGIIEGWMHSNNVSIPSDERDRIADILAFVLSQKRSATKEDFARELLDRGIEMTDQRLSYHIRYGELSGLLCSGDLLPMKASYSLVSQKLPPKTIIDREEALSMLASRYFLSRGAATLEDFVWWTGLNIRDCRRAVSIVSSELHTQTYKGREYYISDRCRTKANWKDSVLLLPSYDEYLLSYKSRDLVLEPRFRHLAHNNSGNFSPIVSFGGMICANWTPFSGEVSIAPFVESERVPDCTPAVDRYKSFLLK